MLRTYRPDIINSDEALKRTAQQDVMPRLPHTPADRTVDTIEWSRVATSPPPSAPDHVSRLCDEIGTGEQYRLIRTRIAHHEMKPQTVLISSPGVADGKTTTAISLAWVLALRDNAKTLLIDGDLRRPSVGRAFGTVNQPGLAEVLRGTCTVTDGLFSCEQNPRLYVMPAGINRRDVTELLDTQAYHDLITIVRKSFDFIIIDAPPVGAVADYELLERSADGVAIIVRPDHTDRRLCANALAMVSPELLLGVVINFACALPFWKAPHSYYDYAAASR